MITVDTNVLVRAAVLDDQRQSELAARLLRQPEPIAVTLPALCEFCWVLRNGYRWRAPEVSSFVQLLLSSATIVADRQAVAAGLAVLDAGGDFADGVIAHDGRRLGGEVFVSFDRQAVRLLAANGTATRLLG